jgi:hypothetical protein
MLDLIFVHIAKTAGTSLWNLVQSNYSPAEILYTNVWEDREQFSQPHLKAIGGHHPFEVFEKLEARHIVTFFRDPLQRRISLWQHFEREGYPWREDRGLTFFQYLEEDKWVDAQCLTFGPSVAQANHVIRKRAIRAALIDSVESVTAEMAHCLAWKNCQLPFLNVSSSPRYVPSQEEREAVRYIDSQDYGLLYLMFPNFHES